MQQKSSGLSLAGLIIGIMSIIFSFIPCIGTLGIFGGILGLILGILGYRQDKRMTASTTLGIVGIVLSSLAIVIAGFQWFVLGSAASEAGLDKEYTTCEEIQADFDKYTAEVKMLETKDEDDMGFSDITTMMQATAKIVALGTKAKEMDCDINKDAMDDFDKPREESESEDEEEGEGEGEAAEDEAPEEASEVGNE